jgi:nucleoside-diphosphate-sugar epimerase
MSKDAMLVLTGFAGYLGARLAQALVDQGFAVTGVDRTEPDFPLPARCRFIKADLSEVGLLREAIRGADLIVHSASIHPWKEYLETDYWDANVRGTWCLYRAAAAEGIRRIVLTSSLAAGSMNVPKNVCRWGITEEDWFPLADLYSLTKHTQEEIAKLFVDSDGIQSIALRPPLFVPKPALETGFLLTGVYATVDDVVAAHLCAAKVLLDLQKPQKRLQSFESVQITNKLPYGPGDEALIGPDGDIRPLVKKHWPKAYPWLIERGYRGAWVPGSYDLTKAQRLLQWQPVYNFEQWFAEQQKREDGVNCKRRLGSAAGGGLEV